MPHNHHIALWQGVSEEISPVKAQSLRDSSRLGVSLENRLDYRQIHPASGQMLMRKSNFDRHTPLSAADINKRVVLLPGTFLGDDLCRSDTEAGHGHHRTCRPLWTGVRRVERFLAGFALTLRLCWSRRFSQRPREPIESCVTHFEDAADIRGLGSVEKPRCFGSIGIARTGALQH